MTDSKELLQSFWDLAECDAAVRLPASAGLLAALQAQQGVYAEAGMCPNLVYTCDRLVLGLASSRKSARQGFAAMLVQVLQTFGPKTVSSTDYLARVHKSIDVSQAASPQVPTGQMDRCLVFVFVSVLVVIVGYCLVVGPSSLLGAVSSSRPFVPRISKPHSWLCRILRVVSVCGCGCVGVCE